MHWGSAAWSSDCHCNVACNVFVQAGATAPRRSQLHGVLHAQCATPVLRPPLLCSTQEALARLLLFTKLDAALQRKIVAEMYERTVVAGEILIKEGDTGLGASELFVVKSGKFEVGCWRLGAWHAQHAMQVAHLHGLFRHASAAALAHSMSACSVSEPMHALQCQPHVCWRAPQSRASTAILPQRPCHHPSCPTFPCAAATPLPIPHPRPSLHPPVCSQVLQRRQGQNVRVNMKGPGDCFGEVSLMYDCPRSATVAATVDGAVWVMDRGVFRYEDGAAASSIVFAMG